MLAAYSRLTFLLQERSPTRAELQQCIAYREHAFNVKTLYRLADPDRSLERIDLRAVGGICRALGVGLDDLIVFAEPDVAAVQSLPGRVLDRLDQPMDGHNERRLTSAERDEPQALVAEAEAIARSNARRLVEHRRHLNKAADQRVADR